MRFRVQIPESPKTTARRREAVRFEQARLRRRSAAKAAKRERTHEKYMDSSLAEKRFIRWCMALMCVGIAVAFCVVVGLNGFTGAMAVVLGLGAIGLTTGLLDELIT
jgi:hypothetical protein